MLLTDLVRLDETPLPSWESDEVFLELNRREERGASDVTRFNEGRRC